jgi:hypothetical protein
MKISTLKDKFTKLQKTKTLKEIGAGQKPPITSERVRQIINTKVCDIHHINYYKFCKYCFNDKEYTKVLSTLTKKRLEQEITKLARKGRDGESSLQRKLLIKKLKDSGDPQWTFSYLAKKFKRDRSTIHHLYHSK